MVLRALFGHAADGLSDAAHGTVHLLPARHCASGNQAPPYVHRHLALHRPAALCYLLAGPAAVVRDLAPRHGAGRYPLATVLARCAIRRDLAGFMTAHYAETNRIRERDMTPEQILGIP